MSELLKLARYFLHVRELSGNTGARVEAIQRWGGGTSGQSWCAYFATLVLDLYYGGKSPIPRTGSCDEILAVARAKNLIVPLPEPGALYLRLNSPTDAHHVGLCTTTLHDGRFGQISGNTSKDGLSDNGDGVYERDIPMPDPSKIAFVRLPAR